MSSQTESPSTGPFPSSPVIIAGSVFLQNQLSPDILQVDESLAEIDEYELDVEESNLMDDDDPGDEDTLDSETVQADEGAEESVAVIDDQALDEVETESTLDGFVETIENTVTDDCEMMSSDSDTESSND